MIDLGRQRAKHITLKGPYTDIFPNEWVNSSLVHPFNWKSLTGKENLSKNLLTHGYSSPHPATCVNRSRSWMKHRRPKSPYILRRSIAGRKKISNSKWFKKSSGSLKSQMASFPYTDRFLNKCYSMFSDWPRPARRESHAFCLIPEVIVFRNIGRYWCESIPTLYIVSEIMVSRIGSEEKSLHKKTKWGFNLPPNHLQN